MSIHSDGTHEPRVGTYPPFGDNLEGNLSEEDGVDQRGEPPSWLPEGGRPRTGAAADLRNPEADEAAAGTTDGDTSYSFSGGPSYPDSQDTTFGQPGAGVGGYSYDAGPAGDATSAVPPYPASLTEPAGGTAQGSTGKASTGMGSTGTGSTSKSPGVTDSPAPPMTDEGRNSTSTFAAVTRGRYKGGSGRAPGAAAGGAAGGAALGGSSAAARPGSQAPARRAELVVARLEPWSVMKFSFVISLVAFIVLFVAVAVLYAALSGLGVFSALQHTVSNITSSQSSGGFNLMTYISASRVLGYTGLLGAINVVLITALSTVGAVLYNITSDLAGGIEITLKESD